MPLPSDQYPISAVRRVSRKGSALESGSEADPPLANPTLEVGRAAQRILDLGQPLQEAHPQLRRLGNMVAAALPLELEARRILARFLGIPEQLALRWVQDSVTIFRYSERALDGREAHRIVAARLEAIARCWGDPVTTLASADESRIEAEWRRDLSRALPRSPPLGTDSTAC